MSLSSYVCSFVAVGDFHGGNLLHSFALNYVLQAFFM